jgi:microcystin-dependent protein
VQGPEIQSSLWDTMFAAVAVTSAIPCTALGVNTLALTPMAGAPSLNQYQSLQLFSFIAPSTTTGPVRAAFMGLPQLNVMSLDGVTQIGAAGLIAGSPYMLMFSAALADGAGGFYLLSFSSGQGVVAGAVSFYAGLAAHDPPGWYICDGRAVNRGTDAPLFAVIGTTYGIGDGSTTFNIPKPGGYFLRSLDNGAGVDPGRALGSLQGDQFQDHTHSVTSINGNVGGTGTAVNAGAAGISTGAPNSGNHGSETRPKNMALNVIIKR